MKYLQTHEIGGADCSADAVKSSEVLTERLTQLEQQLTALDSSAPLDDRLKLQLDISYVLLDLDRRDEAWQQGRQVFDAAWPERHWMRAVEACDVLFQADRDDAIVALAHGIWLAVTYPVDPELTVAMLQHLIEETPEKSDGAAVAAAVARYVVDLRAVDKQRDDLQFFTAQLLGDVARRHSQVDEQEVFDFWIERLELNDPAKFLPRLAKILDVLVVESWWFDRDHLRSQLPD